MANNGGDVLARGARKATFPASGSKVSQEKWDAMWTEDTTTVNDLVKDKEPETTKE